MDLGGVPGGGDGFAWGDELECGFVEVGGGYLEADAVEGDFGGWMMLVV